MLDLRPPVWQRKEEVIKIIICIVLALISAIIGLCAWVIRSDHSEGHIYHD
jgi:hypothetical protein